MKFFYKTDKLQKQITYAKSITSNVNFLQFSMSALTGTTTLDFETLKPGQVISTAGSVPERNPSYPISRERCHSFSTFGYLEDGTAIRVSSERTAIDGASNVVHSDKAVNESHAMMENKNFKNDVSIAEVVLLKTEGKITVKVITSDAVIPINHPDIVPPKIGTDLSETEHGYSATVVTEQDISVSAGFDITKTLRGYRRHIVTVEGTGNQHLSGEDLIRITASWEKAKASATEAGIISPNTPMHEPFPNAVQEALVKPK